MSWAEVKKINSDLSKPLNEFIAEYMESKIHYVANADYTLTDDKTYEFTAKYSGTLKCVVDGGSSNSFYKITIYKNGEEVTSVSNTYYCSAVVACKKDDVITAKIKQKNTSSEISYYITVQAALQFGDV